MKSQPNQPDASVNAGTNTDAGAISPPIEEAPSSDCPQTTGAARLPEQQPPSATPEATASRIENQPVPLLEDSQAGNPQAAHSPLEFQDFGSTQPGSDEAATRYLQADSAGRSALLDSPGFASYLENFQELPPEAARHVGEGRYFVRRAAGVGQMPGDEIKDLDEIILEYARTRH